MSDLWLAILASVLLIAFLVVSVVAIAVMAMWPGRTGGSKRPVMYGESRRSRQ